MTTIQSGAQTLTPLRVLGYSSTRESGNRLHSIIGRSDHDVTLREAGLRSGTLEILCADHEDALAMEALHAQIGVLVLSDADLPGVGMRYVTSGRIDTELDDRTLVRWTVRVEFQEVLA